MAHLSFLTLKVGSDLLALEGLPSDANSERSLLTPEGLASAAVWLLAADWPFGLCPVLSSKVIERTARLVGCGLARGFDLSEEGFKYTA